MKAVGVTTTTMVYADAPTLEKNAELIKRLARLESVTYGVAEQGIKLTQTPYDVRLGIGEDVTKDYAKKLVEQQKADEAAIKNLEGRLKNRSYVQNAPPAVVAQTREQLESAEARLAAIITERKRFRKG